jgi:O-antigen ligase
MNAIPWPTRRREVLGIGAAVIIAVLAVIFAIAPGYQVGLANLVALLLLPLALVIFLRRPEIAIYLVFLLLAFFNEYSQTEWGVRSADQLSTLYNWRIVPGLIASVFDLFFAGLVGLWLIRKWLLREPLVWPPRLLWLPIILCLAFVGYATILGLFRLGHGFELYYILRELRPFVYGLVMMVMTIDILTLRATATSLWRLIVVVALLRGIQGVIRHYLGIGRYYYGTTMIYYDYADTILLLIGLSFILTWLLGTGMARSGRPAGAREAATGKGGPVWRMGHRGRLLAAGLVMLPIAYSFIYSFRRSFWIGAAASLVLLPLLANRRERSRYFRLLVAGGLTLVLLVVATGQTALVTQRIWSVTDTERDSSNFFRVLDTENAVNAVYQSAGLGMGFGSRYEPVVTVYWLSDFIQHVSRASHNGYLYVAMKMGLAGLIAWILFWLANLKISWALTKISRYRALGLGVIITLVASGVANLFLPLYYNLRPLMLLAILCGLASAAWKLGDRDLADRSP